MYIMENLNPEDKYILEKSIRNENIDKKNVIFKSENFIDESLLNNLHETLNQYLIHYETFEGKSYPIITIPKGLMLFTGRKNLSNNENLSFFHLFKLYGKTSFGDYEKNSFEDALTYFFPMPIMTRIISNHFQRIDIVTTTQDIRLLCLISPSPISRYDKSDENKLNILDENGVPIYDNTDFTTCPSRLYDICLTNKIIYGLELNGYIGMPVEDSLSKHKSSFYKVFKRQGINLRDTLLFDSSTFNNDIKQDPKMKTILDMMYYQRTFGIPEICLIPYNIHKYNQSVERRIKKYRVLYNSYNANLNNQYYTIPIENFIFKPYQHFIGGYTHQILENLEQFLDENKHFYYKSLQSYPLFNVLKTEADETFVENGMFVPFDFPTSVKNNLFAKSYAKNGVPPYFCAFETMYLYKMLQNIVLTKKEQIANIIENRNIRGGNLGALDNNQIISKPITNGDVGYNNKFAKPSKQTVYDDSSVLKLFETTVYPQHISKIFKENGFFYSERSGIPVVYFDKNLDKKPKGGKKLMTKNKKRKLKNKTKKRRNK